jgi:hypothetical protein
VAIQDTRTGDVRIHGGTDNPAATRWIYVVLFGVVGATAMVV